MKVIKRGDSRFLLLEGLMVLFGVLAALLVEAARENAVERRVVAEARVQLMLEVRQNHAELLDLVEVVTDRLTRLRALREEPSPRRGLSGMVSPFTGYRSPDLSDGASTWISSSSLAVGMPAP